MAELADADGSKPSVFGREGSSPSPITKRLPVSREFLLDGIPPERHPVPIKMTDGRGKHIGWALQKGPKNWQIWLDGKPPVATRLRTPTDCRRILRHLYRKMVEGRLHRELKSAKMRKQSG